MKRTGFARRGSPLRRLTRLTSTKPTKRPPPTKHKARERDTAYMLFVKTLPCWAGLDGLGPCDGPVEADHAGRVFADQRAVGRKAKDWTCVPACTRHHAQRDAFSGPFKTWDRETMRARLMLEIERTRALYAASGLVETGN